jgi:hypothetical protein
MFQAYTPLLTIVEAQSHRCAHDVRGRTTKWIEKYRRQAAERFRRLDAVPVAVETRAVTTKEQRHDQDRDARDPDRGRPGRRRVARSVVDTMQARDMMLASGMEVGVIEGYERLDALLAEE